MDSSEKKMIEIPTTEDMTILSTRFREKTEKKERKRSIAKGTKTQEQERQSKKMELEMVGHICSLCKDSLFFIFICLDAF